MARTVDALLEFLSSRRPLPALEPQSLWSEEINEDILRVPVDDLCRAAFYLWNDHLEGAHKIVQDLNSPTAKLIHAVLHRREPDYSNAKYWYRRSGAHPVGGILEKKYPEWEAFRFVGWCEDLSAGNPTKTREWLESVQAVELEAIARFCLANTNSRFLR